MLTDNQALSNKNTWLGWGRLCTSDVCIKVGRGIKLNLSCNPDYLTALIYHWIDSTLIYDTK